MFRIVEDGTVPVCAETRRSLPSLAPSIPSLVCSPVFARDAHHVVKTIDEIDVLSFAFANSVMMLSV